jgi:hypothetical protein
VRSMIAWPAMKVLLIPAVLLGGSQAFGCELSLVTPVRSLSANSVQAEATLANDALTVHFSVSAPRLNAKKVFDPKEYPYDFDVVELFVTFSESGYPYFEFEVSPYNQTFQVRIVGAKEHHEGVDLGLISTVQMVTGGWKADLSVPLKPLGWDGDPSKIRGNFYSILGQGRQRGFWSTFLPKAAKANFHQPQYFKPLLPCNR